MQQNHIGTSRPAKSVAWIVGNIAAGVILIGPLVAQVGITFIEPLAERTGISNEIVSYVLFFIGMYSGGLVGVRYSLKRSSVQKGQLNVVAFSVGAIIFLFFTLSLVLRILVGASVLEASVNLISILSSVLFALFAALVAALIIKKVLSREINDR